MNQDVIPTGNDFKVSGSVDFFQIYWDEKQKEKFFPWAIPLFNPTLTVFFENEPISRAVLASNAEKIAVCSYALKSKYHKFSVPPHRDLTEEILHSDYDVLSFTRNSPNHTMLAAMGESHKASRLILKEVCDRIGVKFPRECKYPIYQNAFCARADIYKEYVRTALIPAMELDKTDLEIHGLYWLDSDYYKLREPSSEFAQRVKHYLNVDYCPLCTFLLERLFSVWINDRGLNVKYL